uniref:RNA-directed DNA polymerase n=1 Tax=Trichuris muris TaxID=70415 RepID=A0A5S6QMM6_TRIMR
MAKSYNGSLEAFDVNSGIDGWEDWIERLGYFAEANNVPTARFRSLLFTYCGPALYRLVKEAVAPQKPDTQSFDELVQAVRERFDPTPGFYPARAEFYSRKQLPGESVATFMTNLRRLAGRCQFEAAPTVGERIDFQLQDQLLIGMSDGATRRRILRGPKITIKELYNAALTGESAIEQSNLIDSHSASLQQATVHAFGNKRQTRVSGRNLPFPESAKCWRCGANGHNSDNCRFKRSQCYRCGKLGHVSKACRSSLPTIVPPSGQRSARFNTERRQKEVHAVAEEPPQEDCHTSVSEDDLSISQNTVLALSANEEVISHSTVEPATTITLIVNKAKVNFEIDSGSALTLINQEMFHRLWKDNLPVLRTSTLNIKTWSRESMTVLGSFRARVQYRDISHELDLFVLRKGGRPLLGRAWFRPLNIGLNVPAHQASASSEVGTPKGNGWRQIVVRYADVFRPGLGQYKGPPIHIELIPGARARFFKCRPVPFALIGRVKEEIERLDKRGSLEPVLWSDWASPIVVVMKKGGEIRICGDYSATANLVTRKDVYPLPTVPEMMTTLTGGAWFSKLDLAEAYQQLTLDEETAEVLTLTTPKGLRRMKRLPYGVDVAPGIFQRLMETLLQGIPGVKPYLDDILITGPNEEEHDKRLEQVLEVLETNGLRLRKEKCHFATKEMEFLGFRVTKKGIHPTEEKLAAIKEAPPPADLKQLQAFLGLLNFYSAFLPRKATVLEPLHRLLDATAKSNWHWSDKEQAAFDAAKKLLTTGSVLAHFDGSKPLLLACDASDYGLGAVLSQVEEGQEKVVAYASRTMSKTERNYAQIDKEALALMYGVKKFHQYLFGRHFTALTDHKPLLGLLATGKPTPAVMTTRMLRWRLLLTAYDVRLVYRSGKAMGHADGLSRLPLPDERDRTGTPGENFVDPFLFADALMMGTDEDDETDEVSMLDAKTVARLTRKDPVLSRVQHWLLHGWPSGSQGDEFTQYARHRDELSAVRGCLLWGSRVIIPKQLQNRLLQVLHQAHPGTVRMKALARSYVWWPGIDAEIETWVANCSECQQHRNNPPRAPPLTWNWTPQPWSRIHVDFAGPFHGKTYLLVMDSHSKWLEVEPVPSMDAKEAIHQLARIFAVHGLPDTLVSDNGPAFNSAAFRRFCLSNQIRFLRIAPYHPASNGQVERVVHTTKQALRMMAPDRWEIKLSRFLLNYRLTPHSATGLSPAEILLRRRPRSLLDRLHPDSLATAEKVQQEEGINLQAETHGNTRRFQPGDRVWARNFHTGAPTKWMTGVVQDVISPRSYWIELPKQDVRVRRSIDHLWARGDGGPPPSTDINDTPNESTYTGTTGTSDRKDEPELEPPAGAKGVSDREADIPASQGTLPNVSQDNGPSPLNSPNAQSRPARRTRRPRYLDDYVT